MGTSDTTQPDRTQRFSPYILLCFLVSYCIFHVSESRLWHSPFSSLSLLNLIHARLLLTAPEKAQFPSFLRAWLLSLPLTIFHFWSELSSCCIKTILFLSLKSEPQLVSKSMFTEAFLPLSPVSLCGLLPFSSSDTLNRVDFLSNPVCKATLNTHPSLFVFTMFLSVERHFQESTTESVSKCHVFSLRTLASFYNNILICIIAFMNTFWECGLCGSSLHCILSLESIGT